MRTRTCLGIALPLAAALAAGCGGRLPHDEARDRYPNEDYSSPAKWKEAAEKYYPPAYHDYFEDMDAAGPADGVGAKKLALKKEQGEVIGRNAWVLWTAGNEAFWDWLARNGYGSSDLLRLIDSTDRGRRFARTGLMTEPGTRPPTAKETEDAHGVRYDRPIKPGEDPDPGKVHVEYRETENDAGRTKRVPPDPRVYGYPTSVVGLRLFPNPEFDEAAKRRWDPQRYYTDPVYASRPDTIRPFRVGMSCGYCHIAPHPLKPPADPEYPEWENLSNNIGNQYLRFRAAFANTLKPDNYLYHVLDAQLPGALDTSLIPSDNNNNPNTINSFFGLRGRLARAEFNPHETIGADTLAYLRAYVDKDTANPHAVPRVLLDGSDSVGVHIALSRVYLNIGTYHQQWIRVHNPLLGFRPQQPFKLRDIAENSLYWHATLLRIKPMAAFFLASTDPMRLKDVVLPGKTDAQKKKAEEDRKKLLADHLRGTGVPWYAAGDPTPPDRKVGGPGDYAKGRAAFAKGCVACHSSVQPGDLPELEAVVKAPVPEVFLKETDPAKRDKERQDWDPAKLAPADKERLVAERKRLRLQPPDVLALTRGTGALPAGYAQWAQEAVKQRAFWEVTDPKTGVVTHNYLSVDERVPVTVTHTNSGRAVATNALHNHLWEDFASQTYKQLDAVGRIRYRDPFSGAERSYAPPGGGPGYYRVPTLISIWATAPFFHNNALGTFNNDPGAGKRLAAFDDAITRLLWPERRGQPTTQRVWDTDQEPKDVYTGWYQGGRVQAGDPLGPDAKAKAAAQLAADGGWVWRTTEESWLAFEGYHVPMLVGGAVGLTPDQTRLAAWVPALLFVLVGAALLLSGPLVRIREGLEDRVALLGWVFGPVRRILSLGGFALAAGGVYLVVAYWPLVTLLDVGTLHSIWGLRLLAVLVPLVLFGSLGLLFFIHRLPAGRVRSRVAQLAGAACLVLAVVVALGPGRFLAGGGAGVRLGPVPEGVPVNILANLDPGAPREKQFAALNALAEFFLQYHAAPAGQKPGREVFEARAAPALLEASKCPDFVTDRGHDYEFMRLLTDEEKAELIALLKTF